MTAIRSHRVRGVDQSGGRNHVKKDLDAYICVFDDCTDPYQLYSSSEEWLAHMSSQHRTRWYCTARDHEPISFETRQQFMDHMERVHPGRFRREQLGFVADTCARALSPTIPNCPFCSETAGNLEAHVRQHLHYFALQSLPWPEDSTQSTDHTSIDASDDTSEELDRATLHDEFDDVPSPEPMQDIEHDPPYHPPPPPPPQGPILGHPPRRRDSRSSSRSGRGPSLDRTRARHGDRNRSRSHSHGNDNNRTVESESDTAGNTFTGLPEVSNKNKEWQDSATATAAAYARELLEGLPPSSKTLDRTPTSITNASQPDTAGNANHCLSPSLLLWYHAD